MSLDFIRQPTETIDDVIRKESELLAAKHNVSLPDLPPCGVCTTTIPHARECNWCGKLTKHFSYFDSEVCHTLWFEEWKRNSKNS